MLVKGISSQFVWLFTLEVPGFIPHISFNRMLFLIILFEFDNGMIMFKKSNKLTWPIWLFRLATFSVAISLTGCASNESMSLISEYATQSSQVQNSLLDVYQEADDARVNAILASAAKDGIAARGLDVKVIDNKGQEKLLQSLQAYSQSIYALATEERGDTLDDYTEKLNSSLVSLSELPQLESINAKQVTLVSTSANALARAYTERARYQALKQIMNDSQPIIQVSLESLSGELNAWKIATKMSMENELRTRLLLLNSPDRCEKRSLAVCETFQHSLEERIDGYRKAYELRARITALDAKFAKLERALKSVQELNLAIVKSLNEDDDFSKKAAKKAIKSTKKQIDAIKTVRKTLED